MSAMDEQISEASEAFEHFIAVATGPLSLRELANEGWVDVAEDDSHLAVAALFEAQGSMLGSSAAFDGLVAIALGMDVGDWITQDLRLMLPTLRDRHLHDGKGIVLGRAPEADVLVLVDAGVRRIDGASVLVASSDAIDPTFAVTELSVQDPGGDFIEVDPQRIDRARALIDLAIAHETLAAVSKALAIAVANVADRVVYGKPLGSYQAVKHQLAEVLEAQLAASALVTAAWSDISAFNALLARGSVDRASRVAVASCLQVCGGLSFTTEFPLQSYVRRLLVLENLVGSRLARSDSLGRLVAAAGQVPRLEVARDLTRVSA